MTFYKKAIDQRSSHDSR